MINYFDNGGDVPHLAFELDFDIYKSNRRKEARIPSLTLANYKINRQLYSSFILDINEAGAFIETDRLESIGENEAEYITICIVHWTNVVKTNIYP